MTRQKTAQHIVDRVAASVSSQRGCLLMLRAGVQAVIRHLMPKQEKLCWVARPS